MVRRIILVFVVLVLIFLGFRLIFGGNQQKPVSTGANKPQTLPEYANNGGVVKMTIDGRVNGDDIHRQIRVTVSRDERRLEIIQGYGGTVIDNRQYYNTLNAYDVFLRALNGQNFLLERKNIKNKDDRGQCPLGRRTIYELEQNGQSVSRLWSSTCSGVGTFAGNTANLQTLFKLQIPDYDKITGPVAL